MIDSELLEAHHAKLVKLTKGTILFQQGDNAWHYWQVKEGEVKMVSYSTKGQEFIQGVFTDGQSFGEPPLFADMPYPCNAEAVVDSWVYKLRKEHFFEVLRDNFDLHMKFTINLSKRIHYKATIMNEISSYDPEHRILTLLDYLLKDKEEEEVEVPFTRQQIADMTGLRVETVIRSIKSLEKQGKLEIRDRKVFWME